MKHISKIKQFMRIIAFCGLLGMIVLPLISEDGNRASSNNESPRHLKHFLYLTGADLYDGRVLLKIKNEIKLTEEQIEKIENLMLEHEAFSIRNSAEIKIKEARLATYLKSEHPKRKEMEQFIRDISNEKTNLIVDYTNYLLDIRALLSHEQLEKLNQLKKEKTTQFTNNKKNP